MAQNIVSYTIAVIFIILIVFSALRSIRTFKLKYHSLRYCQNEFTLQDVSNFAVSVLGLIQIIYGLIIEFKKDFN